MTVEKMPSAASELDAGEESNDGEARPSHSRGGGKLQNELKYSFDTSSIIQAWRENYPEMVFPSLWALLRSTFVNGDAIICKVVAKELKNRSRRGSFKYLLGDDSKDQIPVQEIENEAYEMAKKIRDELRVGKNEAKLSLNDAQLIAHAKLNGLGVVTEERQTAVEQTRRWNYKIPTVCENRDVDCIPFSKWLRKTGWRF